MKWSKGKKRIEPTKEATITKEFNAAVLKKIILRNQYHTFKNGKSHEAEFYSETQKILSMANHKQWWNRNEN